MPRSAPRPRRGRPAFLAAALLIVLPLSVGPTAGSAVGQDEPLLPGLPDGLAAPEGSGNDARTPQPPPQAPPQQERVQENGIDARRFTPVPAAPGSPGEASPEMRSRDDGARPSNGYEFNAPSGQAVPPPPVGPGARLVPGGGGRPGFDPDDSPVLLGVNGTDTTAGVLVTNVIPGTPADRAGLERGDRVLTVAGYQVGVVGTPGGPRVYPLGVELARRLDARGEATLLVQDHRSGQITPVSVRPIPRYGPTNPPGYGGGPGGPYGSDGGSIYGPATSFGAGARPYDSNLYDANRYDPNRYDGGLYDRRDDAFDSNPLFRGGTPRR